jgi:hypothetical protein
MPQIVGQNPHKQAPNAVFAAFEDVSGTIEAKIGSKKIIFSGFNSVSNLLY